MAALSSAALLSRMDSLGSFAFRLSYHSAPPATLAASYSGVHFAPDIESWTGFWQRAGERSSVRLAGSASTQYEDFGLGWQRSERGVETRILSQARAVFASDSLTFVGRERGHAVYRFSPRLPMLDPAQAQRFTGEVQIDERRLLPLRVACRDSVGAAEWVLTFGRFNSAARPRLPFVASQTIRAVPERRVGCCLLRRAAQVLGRRLTTAGQEHRVGISRGKVDLRLAEGLPSGVVDVMLARGAVEVWTAEWAPDSASPTERRRVMTVGGDAARLVMLGELVCRNDAMSAKPDLSLPVSPVLVVMPTRPPAAPSRLYVLIVDGKAVGASSATDGRAIRFSDIGNAEMVTGLAAVAAGPESPVGLIAVR